jgi:nicotinamidase-related amidase
MKNSKASQNTALLVMDVENAIVNSLDNPQPLLDSLRDAIETVRKNSMPVIYIKVAFREGYPEVSEKNKSFSQLKSGAVNLEDKQATAIHFSIAPQPNDIIITKKRVSAFTGSDLEVVLRSLEINHLLLTGIATSGVVLSTLREAADKDYQLTVLSNCCADRDEEVHRVLMTKVFPRQAEVINLQKLSDLLQTN